MIIGTRGSKLALAQTEEINNSLSKISNEEIKIKRRAKRNVS